MGIQHLLWLVVFAPTACAPPSGKDFQDPAAAQPSDATAEAAAWKPCSTTATLLTDIHPGPMGSAPGELVHVDGALYFTADDGAHGRELWRSSGTGRPGTLLVKDILPGVATSAPRGLTAVGNTLFFTADDGVHGRELWVSDGSAAGTQMVKDIWPGPVDSGPDQLLAFGGAVYFAANDGVHGNELWRSDGTSAGTVLVEDLYPGDDVFDPGRPGSSNPRRLTRAGEAFYFVANVGSSVRLWRSVGVPGATSFFAAPEDNFLFSLTAVGSSLFFLVDNDEGEASLWRTKAAPAERLRFFHGLYPHDLTALGKRLLFSAGGSRSGLPGEALGEELWASDGTAGGTARVKDIWPGEESSAPGAFAVLGERLVFAADDGVHGRELWKSDGTAAGTSLLRELALGAAGSSPQELKALSGTLFFSAETPGRGREPWVSDGTAAGTVPLTEIAPGPSSSEPHGFVRSGWNVFFTATDAAHGQELWALPFRPEEQCPKAFWEQ